MEGNSDPGILPDYFVIGDDEICSDNLIAGFHRFHEEQITFYNRSAVVGQIQIARTVFLADDGGPLLTNAIQILVRPH